MAQGQLVLYGSAPFRRTLELATSLIFEGQVVQWLGLSEIARVGTLGLGKTEGEFALTMLSNGNDVLVYNRSKEYFAIWLRREIILKRES